MTKITEKKVHTKALHLLLMMETVKLAMQAEHVTNIGYNQIQPHALKQKKMNNRKTQ